MAFLTLDKVDKRFGEQHTIKGVDLAIEKGEFIVFVGPSGCGKSTLLRLIAGLTDVDGGRITLDGRDITALHSSQRDLAMVFQSYALYPHMSVFDNMSFALRLAKAPRAVIEEKVQRAAEILNLKPYLQRTPRELSGGQRQRVAIGRAIVRAPKVFLFDEPLSNLDAALRGQTRIEIHKLHTDLNATTIYVTHDQVEAMTLADRVVVLRDGAIEQVGSPLELYDRPANTFVAQFIGTPAMNVLAAGAVPSFARLTGGRVPSDGFIGLRPEALSVTAAASAGGASGAAAAGDALPGRLELVEELGAETNLYVQMAAPDGAARISLVARGAKRTPLRPGDAVQVRADPALLHLFDGRGVALH